MNIVYTTIFGGSNQLPQAPKGADRAVCFVDDITHRHDPKGWELVLIPTLPRSSRRQAWHMRCESHKLFPEAKRTIWIDASMTLHDLPLLLKDAGEADIAALRHHERKSWHAEGRRLVKIGQATWDDMDRQLEDYKAAKFTCMHLSISCILVRRNGSLVRYFNETWDEQIQKYPGDNTQVSLDYSAWKAGTEIRGLRGTRHVNPYAIHDHIDHKQRRKPYERAVAA